MPQDCTKYRPRRYMDVN